jgi:hypothetical protein
MTNKKGLPLLQRMDESARELPTISLRLYSFLTQRKPGTIRDVYRAIGENIHPELKEELMELFGVDAFDPKLLEQETQERQLKGPLIENSTPLALLRSQLSPKLAMWVNALDMRTVGDLQAKRLPRGVQLGDFYREANKFLAQYGLPPRSLQR